MLRSSFTKLLAALTIIAAMLTGAASTAQAQSKGSAQHIKAATRSEERR